MTIKYTKLPSFSSDQIEAEIFGEDVHPTNKGTLIYAAVYTLDDAAVVSILKRTLAAVDLETQLVALEAIEAFMQSRKTAYGAKELKVSVTKFAADNPNHATEALSTLATISEFEKLFSRC
ncbi:hypothetical protein SAMN04488030_2752 [Aliiroseovarius halocynthiae]|uniref:hypothetical protein n=1 Tax=Aliiroseovarius halocynthiae TaxID=985055 RepID=UPI00115D7F2F|nr:hypothetical protein [Aliiroseovarius halocynthiae]SMR82401.1 hypothetical protein SAMN04488030_2752 [Aliiroseovarius halocynthiae]